jgi:hypothetical protein
MVVYLHKDDLVLFQLAKKRKISRGKGKQAMLTEEMVYEMNRFTIR